MPGVGVGVESELLRDAGWVQGDAEAVAAAGVTNFLLPCGGTGADNTPPPPPTLLITYPLLIIYEIGCERELCV